MKQVTVITTLALIATLHAGCTKIDRSPSVVTPSATTNRALAAYEREGFVVKLEDGRLWVFREGSKELAEFEAMGELAKHVIRPAAGPGRITIKAPDSEIIEAYLAAQ